MTDHGLLSQFTNNGIKLTKKVSTENHECQGCPNGWDQRFYE